MGAFESGQSFLAGVLAKLPEEQRAQAKAIFDAAEAKDAVTLVGDGSLARSDYSKQLDAMREKEQALQQHYDRLNDWFAVNKDALDDYKTIKAGGGGAPNPPTPTPPATPPAATAITPEEIRRLADQAVNDAGRDYIAVSGFLQGLGSRHLHTFNEPLDTLELVQNPKVGRPIAGQPGRVFSLQDAYNEKYGERIAAKQKEADEKRFNDEVDKRLADRVKAQSTHPFPLRNESSPLDVLQNKDGSAAHTLDTAVAEYERLQSARGT